MNKNKINKSKLDLISPEDARETSWRQGHAKNIVSTLRYLVISKEIKSTKEFVSYRDPALIKAIRILERNIKVADEVVTQEWENRYPITD